ncbi:MAG TPA: hypothetical protein VGS19_31705 [Streptosporangiaceae bacterium]|nr:hypothetical protein [Streptosporangiaceae bacterium]
MRATNSRHCRGARRRLAVALGVPAFLAFVVVTMTTACSNLGKLPSIGGLSPSPTTQDSASTSRSGLIQVHDPGKVTGTLHGPCHTRHQGQLPDRHCTPGAYDPGVTAATLCSPSYSTDTYRAPEAQTEAFKWNVAEPAYGQHDVSGELDHLISLELGGANDASNLWVEAGSIPNPKDSIENALHDWVCSATGAQAQRRLRQAQHAIAHNWLTAEAKVGLAH